MSRKPPPRTSKKTSTRRRRGASLPLEQVVPVIVADETRLVDRATEERRRLLDDVRLRDRRLETSEDILPVRADVEVTLMLPDELDALEDDERAAASADDGQHQRSRRGR